MTDRYQFTIKEDHTVILVTQRKGIAQFVLLMNHDDAEIIERQSYSITFAIDKFRTRVYIHGKHMKRRSLARWVLGLQDAKTVTTFKNQNPFDFRKGNLITCGWGEPSENRTGPQKNSTSGVRGVSWYKPYNKWNGQVVHKGKRYSVGYDADKSVIEQAVIAKRRELLMHSFKDQEV